MREELGESPAIVERLLAEARSSVEEVARRVRDGGIRTVVIAARGTSDHAAVYAQYVLGARNGLIVAPATPSLSSLYDRPPRFDSALVLGISQSGRSPDVVSVLTDARAQGAPTVAITNDAGSELAAAGDIVIDLRAGAERAVAATKTYLAEIAVVAMLSAALDAEGDGWADLERAPAAMREALDTEAAVRAAADARSSIDECIVLARGYQYATGREWALKLKELTHVVADPYSSADFRHGPIALVDEGFPVLAVASTGPALDGMIELLDVLAARGADLLVLSDDPGARDRGTGIELPSLPEWVAPLAAIIPAQLFAYRLALAKGLDPDAPRNLTKVTRTV
jgi:glutamine---fructose-6-phosphate transaminase (isomerizing)